LRLQSAGIGERDQESAAKHEGRAEIETYAGQDRRMILHSFYPPRRISSDEQSASAAKERVLSFELSYSTHPD
jgi:hypothetical protein